MSENNSKYITPKDSRVVIGNEIISLDLNKLHDESGNLYYSVAVLGKRAEQIGAKLKKELHEKLAEFGVSGENLEEVVENREQIEIAKVYEEIPKPTLLAIEEFMNHKTYFRNDTPGSDQVLVAHNMGNQD
jgi:DNA-directed RNA polymerase subunit K/omega